MYAFDKNSVSAEVLQNHFAETKNCFGKHVEIYTDGSKIDESVACAVICGNQIKSMRLPDKSSMYTAKLSAIRMALECIRRLKEKSFVIYSDSLSSLQAIQSFDIINITVFSILKLYTQLTDMGKHVSLCWILSHVGIKGNEMADNAAKEGIRSVITQSKIPPESFFPHISKLCMEVWQDSWDSTPTNKLFSIKPVLGKNKLHTSLCRRDETVITRLRIGHSQMTHSYLLSRESQPVCDHYKCHLTVKHMLLECPLPQSYAINILAVLR